ncbi:MAG: helix-turn-helix domain-containing protein [Pseudomonadales bacterium]
MSFLSRDLSRGLMAKSSAKGHKGLKLNWDTVFLNLDFREGSRIVDLAQANGLTKQAMSQIVAEIEKQGYITKQEDPDDGRAKKIALTARGKQLIQDSMSAYDELEAEYENLVGAETLAQFKNVAAQLVQLRVKQKKS